jgi:hypothetical protein
MSTFRYIASRPGAFFRSVHELSAREQRHLRAEIVKVRGLMPLLMKPRNAQHWTHEEKRELTAHLRTLSTISPYLVVLALPGGLLMLPALAWWLDRRRNRNRSGPPVPPA